LLCAAPVLFTQAGACPPGEKKGFKVIRMTAEDAEPFLLFPNQNPFFNGTEFKVHGARVLFGF